MRFVVSTIGTSILTNPIDNRNPKEATWRSILNGSANLKQDKLTPETETVIETLADRALCKLLEDDVSTNRQISAELNGIYGIYEGQLPQHSPDLHYLICTDTAQGRQTGKLIKDFLEDKGFAVKIFIPSQLSTKDTGAFATGTKELIKWLDDTVSCLGGVYDVIFNLVGGFKGLQGYMQTFGAFYADEIVYIFEGSTDLIRIPRLPIQIDTAVIQQYRGQFAMMAARAPCSRKEVIGVANIPETLLDTMENCGQIYVGLSAWGELIWNQTKEDLLQNDTLLIQNELKPTDWTKLALMNAGKRYLKTEVEDIPTALLEFVKVHGTICAQLSVWGQSVWNEMKEGLLARNLLPFPRLQYQGSFLDDFRNKNDDQQRYQLQETLAKVAYTLDRDNGNTLELTQDTDLQYRGYNGVPGIDHFNLDDGRRVSCEKVEGNLILRHCGPHDYVNRKP